MIGWSHALVTGGAGFIGSQLSRALLAQGRAVTVLDNLSVGRRDAVPDGARFVHGDVRDAAAVAAALQGVDCVFHLAAQVTIRGSFDRFYEDLDTNVMGTASLVRAVDPAKVKWFTLASSMAVYADASSAAPIDERHPARPISPYGVGKLAAEGLSRQVLAGRAIPFTALRFFNTFGPGQTYTPYVGVLTIFVTRLLRGQDITIFGDGEQQRDFIHVSDIVAGTIGATGHAPGTFNLGTGRGTSLNQLATLVLSRLAPGTKARYAEAQPGELRFSVANIDAARRTFGFAPSRSLERDLDEVVDAVKAMSDASGATPRST
jgi:UDP-glucose 4-epimerase